MNENGSEETLNPSLILLHAEQFRRSAIVLCGDENVEPSDRIIDMHVIVPQAVLYAFAAEIYFKFLILKSANKNPPHSHNLRRLFELIPHDVQMRIRSKWNNAPPAVKVKREMLAKSAGVANVSFDTALDESAEAFQRLRYSYQYPVDALKFFLGGDVMEDARRVIYEMYPSEYADVRLPLPSNAIPAAMGNYVLMKKSMIHKSIRKKGK